MTDALEPLHRLARRAGIQLSWHDLFGVRTDVPDDTLRALLSSMGYAVGTGDAVAESLRMADLEPWRRILPPAMVVDADAPLSLPIVAGEGRQGRWRIIEESGREHAGEIRPADLAVDGAAMVDGTRLIRARLAVPVRPGAGHHVLTVTIGDEEHATALISAPARAFGLDDSGHDRRWGVASQLYGLRDAAGQDIGIGDLGTLARLAQSAAGAGAAFVGVNPLSALFPAEPGHISPYSPSSRAFLNPLYIDLTAIPEFAECADAQAHLREPVLRAAIAHAAKDQLVDYASVAALKMPALVQLHRLFRVRHRLAGTARGKAFARFRSQRGGALERFALFETLHGHFYGLDRDHWSWRRWPVGFRRPDGASIAAFAADHAEQIEFHAWLQWVADEQLAAAQAAARSAGMAVGLYQDLAVAEHPDGAAAWADPQVVLSGASIGAPPDHFNPAGQNWGLAPLSPEGLRAAGYAPFIAALRGVMRHAGAVRIDHAMGLTRLFCIPEGRLGADGAYLQLPMSDMMRIVALESQRARCLVVGEDLGVVPEGFRDRMDAAGMLSYRVLWFEREEGEGFKPPAAYPPAALVTVATHDLPTLSGWWDGRDLAWRARLGFYPDEAARLADGHERFADRHRLLRALAAEGLLPDGLEDAVTERPLTPDLAAAIHRYLARSQGLLMAVAAEDLAGAMEQPNIPGTIDAHPNWRRRLPVGIDTLFDGAFARAIVAAVRKERPNSPDGHGP